MLLLEIEAGLRDTAPEQSGSLMVWGLLRVGRQSPWTGRLEEVGYDGNGLENRACRVSCGLEETGVRWPAFPGIVPEKRFSAFSTADKKSYKETEKAGLAPAFCLFAFKTVSHIAQTGLVELAM